MMLPKNDGTWGMFVDYQALNKITMRNRYHLPRIYDLLDQLKNVVYFTKLYKPRVNFPKKYIEKDLVDLPNPAGPRQIWRPTVIYRTLLNSPEKNISNMHIVTRNTQKGEVRGLNPETSPSINTLIYAIITIRPMAFH
jgi:hypothetical protein